MQTDDAWRAVVELAASRHGVFHRDQAAAHGVKNRRLARAVERGELHHPVPNVFTLASHGRSWKQRLMIHSAAGGAASHRAAAALLGLDGCRPGVVEVCLPRHADNHLPDAIVHRWRYTDQVDLIEVDGIRCADVARTLVQLGRVVSPARVEQALDSALRLGHPLRGIEETLERLWRPGPTGAGVLLRILQDPKRGGALPDSWFERLLTDLLRLSNLPPPELQHEIVTAAGPRRLDLAFADVRLGIEAHSRRFHFGPGKQAKDDQRDLELAAMGWELVYVTWPMMTDRAQLISLIERVYRARSTPKPPIGRA